MAASRIRSTVLCAFAVLALSGCETFNQAMTDVKQRFAAIDFSKFTTARATGPQTCPEAVIVDDLESMSEFTDPANPVSRNLVSTISLTGLNSECTYNEEANNVAVQLAMNFEGRLGPRGRARNGDKPFFAYPYFVAVTTPGGEIMAKEVFATSVSYGKEENMLAQSESLRQIIPLEKNSTAKGYKVLVGFQLDEQQLAYNRAAKEIGAMEETIEPAAGTPTNLTEPIDLTEE